MRILLIDDDRKNTSYLSRGLSERGYMVDVAARGEQGLQMFVDRHYDLVVLELALPGICGFDVLEQMRARCAVRFVHAKVMFFSAKDSVENRVRGLRLGADDFMGKPFACAEFLARVQVLLRRGPREDHVELNRFCVSDLCLDFDRQQAWRQRMPLNLTAREFALLSVLMRRPGKVFTREMLEDLVWENVDQIETKVVDVAIRRLRKKVDDPFPEKLIHTRRGVGYVLEGRCRDQSSWGPGEWGCDQVDQAAGA